MRKLLFIFLACNIAIGVYSQKRVEISKELRDLSVQKFYKHHNNQVDFEKPLNHTVGSKSTLVDETLVGGTIYDLQSNSLLGNRIWLHSDGTIGTVWTMGVLSPPSFPDRGTGYNYFDGTTWAPEPQEKIETVRAGWPSYAPLGENGEIVVSHDFAAGVLLINTRPEKGTGSWTETTHAGPDEHLISWGRMVTSGINHEIIHTLSVTFPTGNGGTLYNGQDGALLYSRSTDGGVSFDISNLVLDGTGIDNYSGIRADEYTWAEPRAGVIAFVCAETWRDMFMMKSEDDGDTWDKTVIWEHPYPFFDWETTIFTDTLYCTDASADIAIDNDGMVHVVFGISRVAHFEVGTTYTIWPFTDGIGYWNETMDPFEADNPHDALDPYNVLIPDVNLVGWSQDVDGDGEVNLFEELITYRELGISTMPNISVGPDNRLYIVYASTTENTDLGGYNAKRIWVRNSHDGGTTWGNFYDLSSDLIHIFDECFYPVMAGSVDDNIHVMYQYDAIPGTALDEDHAYIDNFENYVKWPVVNFTGIEEPNEALDAESVSQNYPNPFSQISEVWVNLKHSAELSLDVIDIMGKKVFEVKAGKVAAGQHKMVIDASELTSGIYFYAVKAGDSRITKKMIVE
jgi:hypothetical protein